MKPTTEQFVMHYTCARCYEVWEMENDCSCDDRCPSCDLVNEPTTILSLEEEE